MTSKEIVAIFEQATQANWQDENRQENVVTLSGPGDVVMTGDLHGNERNFDKLVRQADLGTHPNRHLVLHEIIHGADCCQEWCESFDLLAKAAALKTEYPNQVHFLMGNHDIAQVSRQEILKNGLPMVRALLKGIERKYNQNAPFVVDAMDDFLISMPLAVKTGNHIWMSHTLPGDRHIDTFSDSIFHKKITLDDLRNNASLKALTWDRRHSEGVVEKLSQRWDVVFFIMGHEPQSAGYKRACDRLLILSSEHAHGCYVQFELAEVYSPDDIVKQIKPLASLH